MCVRWFLSLLALLACAPACSARSDDPFVAHVRTLSPSVVLLTMKVPPENKSDRYDEGYATGTIVASGSWGSDVLTVAHAVAGSWDVRLTVKNGRSYPAKIVATDSDMDVALVRTTEPGLPVAELGQSARLQDEVGREVAVLGYPIPDEFEHDGLGLATSLNVGRLSSLRKDALEVTLPIVPGESGGPVFVADTGEIIGVAEARFDDERSIGFALPVDDAKKFLHRFDAAHGF